MSPEVDAKELIISFVREKFLSGGFARLSVDEISSGLAISKKTLYKHFGSKEDLIYQVADRVMGEAREQLSGILSSDHDFITKLNELMTFLGFQIAHFGSVVLLDFRKHAPDLFRRVQQFRRERIHEVLGKLLLQGMREGHIRPDVNVRVFMLAFLSAVENILQPATLAQESFSVHEGLRSILAIFFHGILTEEASTRLEQLQLHS